MDYQISKKITFIKTLLALLLVVVFSSFPVLATSTTATAYCNSTPITGDDPPSLAAIVCPLIAIINALVISASVIFAVMIGWAGIKMSLALGDPKGFEGARTTAVYAFIGLCVVLGFFAILNISANLLGISTFGSPEAVFTGMIEAVNELLQQIGVCVDGVNVGGVLCL